jgi:pilus assembly protein FimV
MKPLFHFFVSLLGMASLSFNAHALTLAGMEVQSHKGEPLRAEVSVVSASAEEWEQLNVKIASAERFAQLGLVYTPAVGQLQTELYEAKDGTQRIRIFGPQNFSENFVDVLLEAQTASGKWVKAFTLMLKPAPAKKEAPIQLATMPSALPKPSAEAPEEHIVQQGESASQIIQKWLTEGMSTQQMLVALLKNQPEAFIEGNVNLLRAGAVLKSPTATAVRAIDPDEARQFLVTQQKEFLAFSQAASQSTQLVKSAAPSRQMAGKVGQEEALKAAESTIDQLKLTQAKIEKQNAESRLAAQRALQDAQKQLNHLQDNVNQLVKLTAPPPAPIAVGTTAANTAAGANAGQGWLNLDRLLDASHKNSYLWLALTLLGVLAVWAGIRIQGRKSSQSLSTLLSAADLNSNQTSPDRHVKLELPADITALDLNLNAQGKPSPGPFQSPSTPETRL